MSDGNDHLLAGLPDDVRQRLVEPPLTEKKLLELSASWPDLTRRPGTADRDAAAVRHHLGSTRRVPAAPTRIRDGHGLADTLPPANTMADEPPKPGEPANRAKRPDSRSTGPRRHPQRKPRRSRRKKKR